MRPCQVSGCRARNKEDRGAERGVVDVVGGGRRHRQRRRRASPRSRAGTASGRPRGPNACHRRPGRRRCRRRQTALRPSSGAPDGGVQDAVGSSRAAITAVVRTRHRRSRPAASRQPATRRPGSRPWCTLGTPPGATVGMSPTSGAEPSRSSVSRATVTRASETVGTAGSAVVTIVSTSADGAVFCTDYGRHPQLAETRRNKVQRHRSAPDRIRRTREHDESEVDPEALSRSRISVSCSRSLDILPHVGEDGHRRPGIRSPATLRSRVVPDRRGQRG